MAKIPNPLKNATMPSKKNRMLKKFFMIFYLEFLFIQIF